MVFMKSVGQRAVIVMLVFISGSLSIAFAAQDIRFSSGWKFYRGNPSGAEGRFFNDASWQTVHLPHSDSINLHYNSSSHYTGYSWYRKAFSASDYQGKKLLIEFEGAMQTAVVYCNGVLLTTHCGGYTPFVLDVTNSIRFDTVNVVAVQLNNSPSSSFPPGNTDPDFLYFGGLYRNVWLHSADSMHITNSLLANRAACGGIFAAFPSVGASSATVQIKTHVINEYALVKPCIVVTDILDTSDATVASNSTPVQNVSAGASLSFIQSMTVSNPHLWHPNAPYLYKIKTAIMSGSSIVDTCTTPIGIRTIAFSKGSGFQINGSRFIFRGANRHQSYPYIGNAVPNSGHYRDALLLKQYGFNFVRLSHYVQAQGFIDACDKLGILVMACLPGWQYFNSDGATFSNNSIIALRDMIRYYRNHPSVILWEAMHNETYGSTTPAFLTAAQTAAHEEYPGDQMFTCGEEAQNGTSNATFDVFMGSAQHGVRNLSLSRPIVISEYGDWEHSCKYANPITGCLDRVDRSEGEQQMLKQANDRADDLSLNRGLSWITGDGLWSAFDYQSWSRDPLTASGAFDIFRLPKFCAYFFKSQRSPGDTLRPEVQGGPMVYIASYWNNPSTTNVTIFSNCEQVRLSLNGTIIATQSPVSGTNVDHPKFSFAVPSFQSGTLKAEGLIGGIAKASHSVATPGTAKRLSVVIDTAGIPFMADGSDIAIVHASILDSNGVIVPTAANNITFSLSGPGALLGANPVAATAGIASILLQAGITGGTIIISSSASGLLSGSDTVTSYSSPTTDIRESLNPTAELPSIAEYRIYRKGNMLLVRVPNSSIKEQCPATFFLCNPQGRSLGRWNVTKSITEIRLTSLPHGVYFGQIAGRMGNHIHKIVR